MLKFIPLSLAMSLLLTVGGSALADDDAQLERVRRGDRRTVQLERDSARTGRSSRTVERAVTTSRRGAPQTESTPTRVDRRSDRDLDRRSDRSLDRRSDRASADSERGRTTADRRGHGRPEITDHRRGHGHARHTVHRPATQRTTVHVGRPAPVRVVRPAPVRVIRPAPVRVVRTAPVRVHHGHGHHCHVHTSHCTFVPGKWGYRLREVVEPGYYETVDVPAVYELRWDRHHCQQIRVLVRPATTRRVWVPARTVTRKVRVWIPRHFTCGR